MKNTRYVPGMSLDEVVRNTIINGELPVITLSREIGYPAHIMNRSVLDEKEPGINLRMLERIMKRQNDFSILDCIAQECGYALVPIPEWCSGKDEGMPDVCEYFAIIARVQMELSRYVNEKHAPEKLKDALYRAMMMTVRFMNAVKA